MPRVNEQADGGKADYAVFEVADRLRALQLAAPKRGNWKTTLTKAAYNKGMVAGMDFDVSRSDFPQCPYDERRLPNFMRNANDPRKAWREGSLDGQRIRQIAKGKIAAIFPPLTQREFKELPKSLQDAVDRLMTAEV